MQNILLVAEVKSYLLISIKEKMKKLNYNIIEVPADTNAIHGIKEPLNGIFIYADETLIQASQTLHFIKDQAIANDIPVFLAGELSNVSAVKELIPATVIRFEFLRPLNVNTLVSTLDGFLRQSGSQYKKKILAVDDSGATLRNVKAWLGEKYHVYLANSAAMAIKCLSLNRPDLILLDYEMPIVDGKQVMEMIRAEQDFADIPVIFLTAKADKDSVMKIQGLKPEGYLLKTLSPADILKAINEFFELKKGLML